MAILPQPVMSALKRCRWFGALLAIISSALAGGPTTFLARFLDRDVQVITVTDMTDAGRLLRRPTKAEPVYYEALVLGYQEYGRSIAGVDVPDKRQMLKFILKLLGDQGYYPATPTHAPEILLTIGWGMINNDPGVAMQFMGGNKADVMWELEGLSIHNAARALTRHLRSRVADFVVESSQSGLYMITVQAFDEELAKQGTTKLLWHTKVSCPAQGLAMTPSLKQMAREAAPLFGRETKMPVWTTAPEREGRVEFGELRVLESIDPDKLPITDVDDGPDAIGSRYNDTKK